MALGGVWQKNLSDHGFLRVINGGSYDGEIAVRAELTVLMVGNALELADDGWTINGLGRELAPRARQTTDIVASSYELAIARSEDWAKVLMMNVAESDPTMQRSFSLAAAEVGFRQMKAGGS